MHPGIMGELQALSCNLCGNAFIAHPSAYVWHFIALPSADLVYFIALPSTVGCICMLPLALSSSYVGCIQTSDGE
eukprot:9411227-Ditylum_brightwellii.AAC.1